MAASAYGLLGRYPASPCALSSDASDPMQGLVERKLLAGVRLPCRARIDNRTMGWLPRWASTFASIVPSPRASPWVFMLCFSRHAFPIPVWPLISLRPERLSRMCSCVQAGMTSQRWRCPSLPRRWSFQNRKPPADRQVRQTQPVLRSCKWSNHQRSSRRQNPVARPGAKARRDSGQHAFRDMTVREHRRDRASARHGPA